MRVQEVFGWAQAPLIAGRPLRLQLLSPAQRVVATTADLAGFWVTGYPAVRSELRGRYPRHPWPEDPAVALPTTGPRSGPGRAPEAAGSPRPGEDRRVTPTPTTDEWGIDASWLDALDEEHSVAPATIDRLREVIGTPPADLEERAPIVARPGDALEVDEAEVVCEDGEVRHDRRRAARRLPARLPLAADRRGAPPPADRLARPLLAARATAPGAGRCSSTPPAAGPAGASATSPTCAPIRRMAADQGAGFVLINPLHAVAPTAGQEASPYLPATRRFRNPIYLRVAEVPGADGVDLEDDAGRALSDGDR